MANSEHLKILKRGVEAWNSWREENPDVRPELGRTNLCGANLLYANLRQANLLSANLNGANLVGADLCEANLVKADLGWPNLGEAGLFLGIDKFLSVAELSEANLRGAILSGADMGGANLTGTNLSLADLRGAILSGADISVADMSGADMSGANLGGATLSSTNFADLDLSTVRGLTTVSHLTASTIGTDTIEKTAEGLTRDRSRQGEVETFLRGAGVSEPCIEFFRSRIGQPIEFYSCFISYSHADKLFARRLYDSLQGLGIRCWLDEKEIRLGDPMLRVVNEAIRMHDKLILCCSESSLASKWVQKELVAAFDREDRENRYLLIPLTLDESLKSWDGQFGPQVRERCWGDFTGWEKDNAKFEGEFEKVVEALRPRAKD